MKATRIVLLAIVGCSLLTRPGLVCGQQSDWSRLMADGDSASSHKQYAVAEESYRGALQYAEAHWKNDARLSATSIKLAEACEAEGKKDEAERFAHRAVVDLSEATKAHKPKNSSEELMQVDVSVALLTKAGDLFTTNGKFPDAERRIRRQLGYA